ncbi:MAG TPA: oxygenase MpaB family protein, partial [Candidatus Binatia bacterium]|nr:oxygenase MpaB family protein [Candidatus Binatia bacterium]
FRFVTAGLLPDKLRNDYGLSWSPRKEKLFLTIAAVIRAVIPWMPARLCIVPNARKAERARSGSRR